MSTQAVATEKSAAYQQLKARIEAAFSPSGIERFLGALERREFKVRDFDSCVLMHMEVRDLFTQCNSWEQGELREQYLSQLERVSDELRGKYSKVYRYY